MLKEITVNQSLMGSHKDAWNNRLKRTCTEFESIFITYMLKSMRNTLVEDGLFGKTNEAKIVKSMFDEKLALGIARGGGIGLGRMLFEELKTKND
ncbi:MAG: rod-binding protein [Deltaproteobacteria bacterium]|nr:rod-binding protein [Deltaproteobacteria bacterium]